MKSAIVALCIIGCAYAVLEDKDAQIRAYTYEQRPEGGFQYAYETDNNIRGQATGQVKVLGKDEETLVISGSNEYISPEGQPISISYVADENGFQPKSDILPTPPAPVPIPELIARALEYIATHPKVEKKL